MSWETFAHDADVGVRGIGGTPGDAFAEAAMALTSVITDPVLIHADEAVAIECAAPDLEMLLLDWLNAVIYAMATRHRLFGRYEVALEDGRLTATAWGEPIDVARHQPAAEIKGASFCELTVKPMSDGRWLAQCVVDV